MKEFNKYRKRPVRFLELWDWRGWQMKVYGISAHDEFPPAPLVETAKSLAAKRLPLPAKEKDRYGVGFIIVHEGADGDYVFVDWWWSQDIVQHHLYGAKKGHDGHLEYQNPPGAGFCVWELAVCWFEREAWIEFVLNKAENPDFDGYLNKIMNADV